MENKTTKAKRRNGATPHTPTNAVTKLSYLLGFIITTLICECDEQPRRAAKPMREQCWELPSRIVCWFHCVIYNTLWCLPLNFVRYKHKLRNAKISNFHSLAFEQFLFSSVLAAKKKLRWKVNAFCVWSCQGMFASTAHTPDPTHR